MFVAIVLFVLFSKIATAKFGTASNLLASKITRLWNNFCSVNAFAFFSEGICVKCRKMLSVYKDQVPEAGHMTEEVAKIADSLSELNLVSM